MSDLHQTIAAFFKTQAVGEGSVVVAVSGGADSVALLLGLVAVTQRPLIVAHVNHQLRGSESDADEAFVRSLALDLAGRYSQSVTLETTRLDVRAAADANRANLEGTARSQRYTWLATVATRHQAAFVATGHTANDQAETVLHHFLRGTGLRGLRGISPRRSLAPGVELLRPLLTITRSQVLDFLRQNNQPYREDSSNQDRGYTRNRIRHDLLPLLLRDYNPTLTEKLSQLAAEAARAQAAEEARIAVLLQQAELPAAGAMVILARAPLLAASSADLRSLARFLWERQGWPTGRMSYRHWVRVAEVLQGTCPAVDLPGGVRLRTRGRVVQIQPPQ